MEVGWVLNYVELIITDFLKDIGLSEYGLAEVYCLAIWMETSEAMSAILKGCDLELSPALRVHLGQLSYGPADTSVSLSPKHTFFIPYSHFIPPLERQH